MELERSGILALLQRRDDRTADVAPVLAAAIDQTLQGAFDATQVAELVAHIGELVLREPARFLAVRAVLEHKQGGHFLEAEAQALRRLDEAHASRVVHAIAPYATRRPIGFGQQTLALVEADRFDPDVCPCP
jgi:hypothetical protein